MAEGIKIEKAWRVGEKFALTYEGAQVLARVERQGAVRAQLAEMLSKSPNFKAGTVVDLANELLRFFEIKRRK